MESEVLSIVPFAENAASAILKARMLSESEALASQQRRLMAMATAIASHQDVDEIFRMVRDTVIESGAADRAGVWIVDGDCLRGTWGTDLEGRLLDEHGSVRPLEEFAVRIQQFEANGTNYWFGSSQTISLPNGGSRDLAPHAIVAIAANRELVGFLSVDTRISLRPLTRETLAVILPFAEQAALAIQNRRIRQEGERIERLQRRLIEIALAIANESDLDETFLMVRNAVMETGIADRAAIWIRHNDEFRGTWGTDHEGQLCDDHHVQFPLGHLGAVLASFAADQTPFWINAWDELVIPGGEIKRDVPHAGIIVRSGSEFLGYIGLDTSRTVRPLTPSALQTLVPFAEQVALAVIKDRIRRDAQRIELRQRRLTELAMMVSVQVPLTDIFKFIRSVIMELGDVDRVGIWIVDGDYLHGTWGTNELGELEDEQHRRHAINDASFLDPSLYGSGKPLTFCPIPSIGKSDGTVAHDVPRAIIQLRADDELLGIVSIDNLLTMRPISEQEVGPLLQFFEQVPVALLKAKLVRDRNRILIQQQRLIDMAVMISGDEELEQILLLLRDSLLEMDIVDRVGIFLVDGELLRGTWGTDEDGNAVVEKHLWTKMSEVRARYSELFADEAPFHLRDIAVTFRDGRVKDPVRQAIVPLRAGGQIVGLVTSDTSITNRPMTAETLSPLLQFCEQASVAIVKSKLLEERGRLVDQQRRLMQIAVAITENRDLDTICQMIRDTIVDLKFVDRAGFWIIDGDTMVGTWGTDVHGQRFDERGERMPISFLARRFPGVFDGSERFIIHESASDQLEDGTVVPEVPQAFVPLRAGGELVGILIIDNLFSR